MVPSHLYCTLCGAANQAEDAFCFACGGHLRSITPSPQYPVSAPTLSTSTGLLPSNHLLKQRYRVVSQLGKGGFGAVYKAEDKQFGNRLLAVKEMSQSGLSPQEIIEATAAFKREAHLLASLKHPNLPSIYDYFNEAKRWYLVMDFIEGETLEEHLNKEKEGRLPWEEALQIGIQLCTVLGYLHRRQPPIIFRDLKPANVMLTPEGHLYLIDFGIARHFKPGQMRDTMAFGSPGYAAPEQYGKTQTTSRADIYSLGATLYHLLTGDNPSDAPFQFAPPQLYGQSAPRGIKILIMQMVEMDESKRPESVDTIKQKLQRIAATKQKTSRLAPTQAARQISFPQPGVPIQSAPPSDPLPSAQTSTSGVSQKTKKQWLDTSNDLYNAKRYEEALAAFEQASQLDPNDASLYNKKGYTLYTLHRYGEALAAFEQAIRFNPKLIGAYKGKGKILRDLGRYGEALVAFEQASQLDPNFAAYKDEEDMLRAKRYEEALATFERSRHAPIVPSLQISPLVQTSFPDSYQKNQQQRWLDTGYDLYNAKRYQDALYACEQALRNDPDNASVYNLKGDVLSDLKRYGEALTAFERAIQLDPNSATAYKNKGMTLKNLKHYEEALTAYERAIQLDPTLAPTYNSKGSVLLALNRYQDAFTAYERAIQLDPTLASAYGNKVVALMHLKRYGEAMAACEQAFQLGLNSAVALANKGSILFALKRHKGALATLEQAIQLDPGNPEIYNHKGIMLHELKRYEEALTAFERAIQLGPNLAITYSNKGNTLVMLKRYEEALAALEKALLLDPNLVTASNLKAKILDVRKQMEDLKEALAVSRRNHDIALVYRTRGRELNSRKNYLEALVAYEESIQLNPRNADVYNLKGDVLINLKRYGEALTAYERAIQLDPSLAINYAKKGFMLYNLRRFEEALATYEQALQLDPNNSSLCFNKGHTLHNLGRFEEALATYEQALQLDPNLAIAYFKKGNVLEHLGRRREAKRAFENAKQLGYRD